MFEAGVPDGAPGRVAPQVRSEPVPADNWGRFFQESGKDHAHGISDGQRGRSLGEVGAPLIDLSRIIDGRYD